MQQDFTGRVAALHKKIARQTCAMAVLAHFLLAKCIDVTRKFDVNDHQSFCCAQRQSDMHVKGVWGYRAQYAPFNDW
jgi:hypothetical protein